MGKCKGWLVCMETNLGVHDLFALCVVMRASRRRAGSLLAHAQNSSERIYDILTTGSKWTDTFDNRVLSVTTEDS